MILLRGFQGRAGLAVCRNSRLWSCSVERVGVDTDRVAVFLREHRDTGSLRGSGIVEVIAEMYLSGIISADGVVDGRLAERIPRIVPVGLSHRGVAGASATRLPPPLRLAPALQ